MSHENKNITTNADGTLTGIHKANPTAGLHIGTDTQVDGNAAISGTNTAGSLVVTNAATISGELTADQGILIGDFPGTPTAGQVRYNNGDLEVWKEIEWKSLTLSPPGQFDLLDAMSFIQEDLVYSFNSATNTRPSAAIASAIEAAITAPTPLSSDSDALYGLIKEANS